VAIKVLQQQGQKRSETARILGVTEGSVRHHLRQKACGKVDGRKGKKFLIEQLGLEAVVKEW
jgi:predicted transcriptional regulator